MKGQRKFKTLDMAYMALGAVLMTVCAWIAIPTTVPFTLQTFAVFCVLGLLGGRRGTISILVYILLGLVGLPVFSGFKSGAAALFGTTGGYILGFLLSGAAYWALERLFDRRGALQALAMALGLILCYAFGTAWFIAVYARNTGAIGWSTALSWCVLPFIVPDLAKIVLAFLLSRRLSKVLKL